MRSTVSGPVQSCSTTLSSPKKYAAVTLLTQETLFFTVEPKSRAKELFAQVCLHLGNRGMVDAELFGLAIATDGEYLFVDPDNKLSKYAPKTWRSSHGQGLDANGCPLLVLHFRLQFYVDSPLLLRDKVTRHHYYLQLRENAVSADRWQAAGAASRCGGDAEDVGGGSGGASLASLCLLAGLALQADRGDRGPPGGSDAGEENEEDEEATDEEVAAANSEPYFAPSEYLPPQLEQTLAVRAVEAHHRGLRGLSQSEAELQYIREAAMASCSAPDAIPSPLRLNLHLYRLNKSKKQEPSSPGSGTGGTSASSTPGPHNLPVWLGICAKGIEIYEENEEKAVMATFLWSNIGKLCFERKKFEIRALNWPGSTPRKFTYYCNSDEKSKHLLLLCRLTHQFSMAMQPRLAEVRRREDEERKRMRELCPLLLELSMSKRGSVGGGSSQRVSLAAHALRHALFPGHVGGHRVHGTHGSQCKGHGDQRVSVISNTSSNTTSGIVSDRVQSLDESEDDLEMEIMINSPPAPSVESLALAHLRDIEDSPHPFSPSPAPSVDSQDGILESSEKDKEEGEEDEEANSNAMPPRKTSCAPTPPTDGSQCSSSCSTVVNPSTSSAVTTEPTGTTPAPTRAGSAHSSCSGHSMLSLACSSTGPSPACCHHHHHQRTTSTGNASSTTTSHRHQSRRSPHARTASDLSVGTCSTTSELVFGHTAQNSADCSGTPGEAETAQTEEEEVGGGERAEDSEEMAPQGDETSSSAQEVQSIDYSVQSAHTYGCPPRRRSTVSSTLDTDSDYVRLPLRPITSNSTDDSDSFLASSPTPPPPPPRDESSGARMGGHHLFLEPPAPRSISMACVASGMSSPGDEPDGRMMLTGSSYSLRSPPIATTAEANARFITTRPHISILTAHTSSVPSAASPSFASPTAAQQQLRAYPPGDARTHPPAVHPRPPATLLASPVIARGVALQPSPHRHLSMGGNGCADDITAKMKPSVTASPAHSPILPVIGPNNYLDVHASKVVMAANHRHHTHQHQHHKPQRSSLLRGTLNSPTKKSHHISSRGPVSPVVSPLPSPLLAHQSRPPSYLAAQRHRHQHHHHHHHHHAAPCLAQHATQGASSSPVAPQPTFATVYTNQVTQSQIEQYKQQLYSDVDYVIYPMKDPALSRQEYMDAKQGSTLMANLQQPPPTQHNSHHHHHHFHGAFPVQQQPQHLPPPPYRSPTKSGVLYRSTPNVSGVVGGGGGYGVIHPQPSAIAGSTSVPFPQHRVVPAPKYASNQNLSCGGGSSASTSTNSTVNSYISEMAPFPGLRPFLSSQSLALTPAPACSFYSASTQNLTYGMLDHHSTSPPPPPPPPLPSSMAKAHQGEFMQVNIPTLPSLTGHLELGRTRSDDNILNMDKHQGVLSERKYYRLPPPPPYDPSVNSSSSAPSANGTTSAPETSPPLVSAPQQSPSSSSSEEAKKADGMLDIRTLREKSKNLDLPLISALCNDRSLLKQTNAFVGQHPGQREGEGEGYQGDADPRGFGKGRPVSWHVESASAGDGNSAATAGSPSDIKGSLMSTPPHPFQDEQKPRILPRGHMPEHKGSVVTSNGSSGANLVAFPKSSKHSYSVSPSKKYPVSGLSTTQISKPQRKVSSCTHTHPQDPRVPLVSGATSLGAAASSTGVVLTPLKATVSSSKSRVGLKQKSSVVP
ncbi:protein expanded [Ischnura elegans]|uniref:protein expanded n=1 Tax=Ischnura elegans TaxID=197161 RepID=UPI001ED8B125|nr:protein expanded [Ischnura elegans]XP_046387567.1 protein expanded [Ischnura elegans]